MIYTQYRHLQSPMMSWLVMAVFPMSQPSDSEIIGNDHLRGLCVIIIIVIVILIVSIAGFSLSNLYIYIQIIQYIYIHIIHMYSFICIVYIT